MTRAAMIVVSLIVILASGGARAADQPATDCLAASANSLKMDSVHRLRAERAELLVCAAPTCPTDIRNECLRRVDDVSAAIPSIMFVIKDAEGNDVSAVKVTMDGETLADHLEGMALAVDPGAHLFTFEAAQQPPVRQRFVIAEGEKRRREVITLTSAAGAPQRRAQPPAAALEVPGREPHPPEDSASRGSSSRILPLVVMGVGVVGLGAGGLFALQAVSRRNDARAACPDLCSDQHGVNLWRDAKRAGDLSTIAFAVGGAGLIGGVILWSTTRPEAERPTRPQVAVGVGTIALRGRW